MTEPVSVAVHALRKVETRKCEPALVIGAGGIGIILQGAIDTFNWREAATVLLAILALVILGEIVSAWLRRRIL